MDLTDEETEFTREMNTGEISQKNLMDCTLKELRIRCANDERIIRHSYEIMKRLEKENADLKEKIESYRASYKANRDIDEEFE